MNKRLIITLITMAVIGVSAALAILFAKGYTFSPQQKKIVGTGIISVTSLPDGASVFVDDHLTTATNSTIPQLAPKQYDIKVTKDGFIPWEKKVNVSEGVVTEVKVTLFPALPTTYPLTFNGLMNPILSPDGQKLAFAVPLSATLKDRQKGGVWVWTMSSQPISFNRGAEPHQVAASDNSLDFTKATLAWSPDSKQVLATLQENGLEGDVNQRNFLLSADQFTSFESLRDITPTIASVLKSWGEDQKAKDEARIATLTDLGAQKIASSSSILIWSPDETKYIYSEARSALPQPSIQVPIPTVQSLVSPSPKIRTLLSGFKTYDLSTGKQYDLPQAYSYQWLPDSRHIILITESKISISDFDGSNVAIIYAGGFDSASVFPWPDSSRLVFLTTYATPTASTPNLFGLNLK